MRLTLGHDGLIRVAAIAAVATIVCVSPMAAAAATASSLNIAEPSLDRLNSNRVLAAETGDISPLGRPPLAFVVSVCLGDMVYSLACRERSLLEAARRLEQLFINNYTTGRAAGSVKVSFPAAVENQEQLRFLREAEDRAIEAATAKLARDFNPPPPAQPLRAWHDAAKMEAFSGKNWLHSFAAGTHQYQVGPARHLLARLNTSNQQ